MFIYVALCILSLLMGQGILRIFKLNSASSFYLSPLVGMVFWTLLLAWGVLLGFTVKEFSFLLWPLTMLLVLYGMPTIQLQMLRKNVSVLILILFLPIAIMAPFYLHGINTYLGSFAPDGWTYDTYGQYIWSYHRGIVGGLAPLYQYASTLIHVRFISSVLLSFLSVLSGVPGDTQAISNVYLCWVFFLFASSCAFFYRSQHEEKNGIVYLCICLFAAWFTHLLSLNNYDNALILGFLPAFVGIFSIAKLKRQPQWIVILSMMIASLLYSYVELAPFILFSALAIFFVRILILKEYSIKYIFIMMLVTAAIVILLCGPFLQDLITFIIRQAAVGARPVGTRVGEYAFPDLIDHSKFLTAYWGFFNFNVNNKVWLRELISKSSILMGSILFGLMLNGMFILFRNKRYELLAGSLILNAMILVMMFHYQYTYGTYKLILISWWLISYNIALSIDELLNIKNRFSGLTKIGVSAFACAYICFTIFALRLFDHQIIIIKSITPYRELTKLRDIVRDEPVIVYVSEPYSNIWANYFMRDMHINLKNYKLYMADNGPVIDKSEQFKLNENRYLLTDSDDSLPKPNLVWSNSIFYLWKLPTHWAFLMDVNNKNGIEQWENHKMGFWLSGDDTRCNITSNYLGNATLSANFKIGPSLPGKKSATLLVTNINHSFSKKVTVANLDQQSIKVPVKPGNNIIILRGLGKPTKLLTGDTRTMLVGVTGLH